MGLGLEAENRLDKMRELKPGKTNNQVNNKEQTSYQSDSPVSYMCVFIESKTDSQKKYRTKCYPADALPVIMVCAHKLEKIVLSWNLKANEPVPSLDILNPKSIYFLDKVKFVSIISLIRNAQNSCS